MVVTLNGVLFSSVKTLFLIFKNKNGNYPIRGFEDNVPGVNIALDRRGGFILG